MKFYWAVLIGFQYFVVGEKRTFTVNDFANAIVLAKEGHTKIVNSKTHMHCIYKCIVRKRCNLFSSNFVPKTIISGAHYSCGLTKDPELYVRLYNLTHSCLTSANYMVKIPKAIGGACSDHKCRYDQVCSPQVSGGYRCTRERGRKKRIKAVETTKGNERQNVD